MTDPAGADTEVRPSGGRWPMADRSLLATVLGLPPIAAIGVAALLTGIGVAVDMLRIGSLGTVFTVCFIAGCVLAVAWVRRSGLFGPMVQPPLLVAVAVPVVVLLAGTPAPGAGVAERLLVIGAPLVNAFPIMAVATGVVLLLGIVRLVTQRPPKTTIGNRRPTRKPRPDDEPTTVTARKSTDRKAGADRKPTGERRPIRKGEPVSELRPRAAGAAPGEARTSRSPRRS